MALIRYKPNPLFTEEVQFQPEHKKGMRHITKETADVVRSMGPKKSGRFERNLKAEGQRIVSDYKSFWHFIEFGSVNNRPFAPFRRGLRAAGMKFKLLPKP